QPSQTGEQQSNQNIQNNQQNQPAQQQTTQQPAQQQVPSQQTAPVINCDYKISAETKAIEHGPLMLELNARPGLNIQIANREGGLKRYRTIEARFKENGKESTLDKVNF
ncbi:hypothetical protein MXE23_14885, partial [Legionella pneumophila]|nr:hypothetical protein [Legionella pneumophila]